jgi:hypothetical protein
LEVQVFGRPAHARGWGGNANQLDVSPALIAGLAQLIEGFKHRGASDEFSTNSAIRETGA